MSGTLTLVFFIAMGGAAWYAFKRQEKQQKQINDIFLYLETLDQKQVDEYLLHAPKDVNISKIRKEVNYDATKKEGRNTGSSLGGGVQETPSPDSHYPGAEEFRGRSRIPSSVSRFDGEVNRSYGDITRDTEVPRESDGDTPKGNKRNRFQPI